MSPFLTQSVAAQSETDLRDVADGFFDGLTGTKEERLETIENCAGNLCQAQRVSEGALDSILNGSESADDVFRRIRFGIEILNETGVTNAIDSSMLERGRRLGGKATRYIPMVRSFNQLCKDACAVRNDNQQEQAVVDFLESALAFGLEVALWSTGVPYAMSFRGTRWIANRTLLRFARHGCNRCIAFAMSELHYALRGSVYGQISSDRIGFVISRLETLKNYASEINYDVNLDMSRKEIEDLVETEAGRTVGMFEKEKEGFLGRILPDIEIDLFGRV